MNINYKQPQFELFPANSATLEDINKPRFLLANLTLSFESLVILAILGIMVALFAYSLGVERGKHLAAFALDERVSAAWNLAPRKPMLPTVRTASSPVAAKPAPMVKTAAKQVAVTAVPAGRFTLQTASYRNEAYAKQEALDLKAKGFKTFLIKKGDFWLVCLGQFATAEAATATLKKVPPKYRDSSVRRF